MNKKILLLLILCLAGIVNATSTYINLLVVTPVEASFLTERDYTSEWSVDADSSWVFCNLKNNDEVFYSGPTLNGVTKYVDIEADYGGNAFNLTCYDSGGSGLWNSTIINYEVGGLEVEITSPGDGYAGTVPVTTNFVVYTNGTANCTRYINDVWFDSDFFDDDEVGHDTITNSGEVQYNVTCFNSTYGTWASEEFTYYFSDISLYFKTMSGYSFGYQSQMNGNTFLIENATAEWKFKSPSFSGALCSAYLNDTLVDSSNMENNTYHAINLSYLTDGMEYKFVVSCINDTTVLNRTKYFWYNSSREFGVLQGNLTFTANRTFYDSEREMGFWFSADNITLDCNGYYIVNGSSYEDPYYGYGVFTNSEDDESISRTGTVIKNCRFKEVSAGFAARSSSQATLVFTNNSYEGQQWRAGVDFEDFVSLNYSYNSLLQISPDGGFWFSMIADVQNASIHDNIGGDFGIFIKSVKNSRIYNNQIDYYSATNYGDFNNTIYNNQFDDIMYIDQDEASENILYYNNSLTCGGMTNYCFFYFDEGETNNITFFDNTIFGGITGAVSDAYISGSGLNFSYNNFSYGSALANHCQVYLDNADNTTWHNNLFADSAGGKVNSLCIYSGSNDNIFYDNVFNGNERAVNSISSLRNNFTNNNFTANTLGFFGTQSGYNNFVGNWFNGSVGSAIDLYDGSSYNTIYGNSINSSTNYGILLESSSGSNNISYNSINTVLKFDAIKVDFSNGNTIQGNYINNRYGILFVGTATGNFVYRNLFPISTRYYVNNTYGGNNKFNTTSGGVAKGNYYGDILTQSITDANFDGYGDSGAEYPYNSTVSGYFVGAGNDYGPMMSATAGGCGSLGANLTLTEDVSSVGTCFTIGANNVTLDCAGYTISGDGTGYGVYAANKDGVRIKNCKISTFSNGIRFESGSDYGIISNNTISDSSSMATYLSGIGINTSYNTINVAEGPGFGLYSCAMPTVFQNYINGTETGCVYLRNTNQSMVVNNSCTPQTSWTFIRLVQSSSNNTFYNNSVNGTYGVGIWFDGMDAGSGSNTFYHNYFITTGLSHQFLTGTTATNNSFNVTIGGIPEGNYYPSLPVNVFDNDLDGWADAIPNILYGIPLNETNYPNEWSGNGEDWAPAKIGGTPPGFCQVYGNTSSLAFGTFIGGDDTGSINQVLSVANNGSVALTSLDIRANNSVFYPISAIDYYVSNMEWDSTAFTYALGNDFTNAFVNTGYTPAAKTDSNLFFGLGMQANASTSNYYTTIEIKGVCP